MRPAGSGLHDPHAVRRYRGAGDASRSRPAVPSASHRGTGNSDDLSFGHADAHSVLLTLVPAACVLLDLALHLSFEVHAEHGGQAKDIDRHIGQLLAKVDALLPPRLEDL